MITMLWMFHSLTSCDTPAAEFIAHFINQVDFTHQSDDLTVCVFHVGSIIFNVCVASF